MIRHITFLVLLVVTGWVGLCAVRIEKLNSDAGFYLPRHDDVGKWRISREGTPRDELRELVSGIGLLQYLLAPLVVGLSSYHFSRRDSAARRLLASCCGVIGIVSMALAFYRGYFSSLGW